MTNGQWFSLVGALLLGMGLTSSIIKRSPLTTSIIYLAVGLVVGPTILNLFHFNPLKESALLEALTEVAVLISLFSAGIKMPVPFRFSRWRKSILLATVAMSLTVAMVAAFAFYVLNLPLGAGVLLGAILAPTDPVLATDVQIRHPGDRDQLRFTLACEAGMNDGSAFPFVMLGMGLLGLHKLGQFGLKWMLVDVLWATLGGIAIGISAGVWVARLGWTLRCGPLKHQLMDDLIGLGLIGIVYGFSTMLHTWGFIAVFFAAVALRQTEVKLAKDARESLSRRPSRERADMDSEIQASHDPAKLVSDGSLVFKEHLERLSEVVLILLIGGTLFLNSWSWSAVGLAMFLFVIARPASVLISLIGSRTPWRIQGLSCWFGMRGIGSLYYLMYAIQHGLPERDALQLIKLTLIVVTLSILLHGVSVKPLMEYFWHRQKRLSTQ